MTVCGCNLPPAVIPLTGVTPHAGARAQVVTGGTSVVALYGPMVGGVVQNPNTALEQGIAPLVPGPPIVRTRIVGAIDSYAPGFFVPIGVQEQLTTSYQVVNYGPPEALFVNLLGPAAASQTGSTRMLQPGESMAIPANWPGNVWVNAVSNGHRFAVVAVQPVTQYPPQPYTGDFPPSGPTGLLDVIPSYLYQEYSDDDDLQGFVAAQNQQTQAYVDWFNGIDLPVYTKLSGALLDWVGQGLYGIARPTLYSGRYSSVGALNTYAANTTAPNALIRLGQFTDIAATSDDVYKRILTWHLFRGDGKQVTARWLKRRVYRFLYGVDGADAVGDTGQVSVVFDGEGDLILTIVTGRSHITGGAIINTFAPNTTAPDALTNRTSSLGTPALAAILKEGIDTGALEMPQQFNVTCRIGVLGGLN